MFGWDDLRFFLEVSRRGRLVGAAQRLGVDHTTVSRRIASLEQALNTQLFDRTPNGYSLTEAGRRLLAHAENVENTAQAIQADLAGENLELSGSVRVSGPEGFMVKILLPKVPEFRLRHPDIELEIVTSSRYASFTCR
jgi:Transcriptional regulator